MLSRVFSPNGFIRFRYSSCIRFFAKKRVVVDEALAVQKNPKSNWIQLNSYNKIKSIAKLSHLPYAHVLKALCTKEGKNYFLTDEQGVQHVFNDERDVIVPYAVAEAYLHKCKKECECVEIDPEYIQEESTMNYETIQKRPVVSVVGEMDHGKTTFLDAILHTHFQKQEFGGTTQLIRANEFLLSSQPCTFLDTPGQSCFSFIRENGSILSDLTLYLVSLYEGPSEEAHRIFSQLKEYNTPVFVLFTKQDLVSEDRKNQVIQHIQSLASHYRVPLLDTQVISCVTGEGLEQLKEKLLHYIQTHTKEVPRTLPAEATILDSSLIPSQGIVLKGLIQRGILSVRDPFICGLYTGRIRNIINLQSESIEKAYPGMVVHILGARKLPTSLRKTMHQLPSGDTLFVRRNEEIERIWDQRLLEQLYKSSVYEETPKEALTGSVELIDGEEYMEVKRQSVIVIADNANSLSILVDAMSTIPGVYIVRTRIGQVTESDIQQCKSSNLRIVSFNVPLPEKVGKKCIYSRIMSDLLESVRREFA